MSQDEQITQLLSAADQGREYEKTRAIFALRRIVKKSTVYQRYTEGQWRIDELMTLLNDPAMPEGLRGAIFTVLYAGRGRAKQVDANGDGRTDHCDLIHLMAHAARDSALAIEMVGVDPACRNFAETRRMVAEVKATCERWEAAAAYIEQEKSVRRPTNGHAPALCK